MDLVLDADDPFVLSRLLGRISDVGPSMLVEPYFRLDQLLPILQYTEITRVLTSEKTTKGERKALASALATSIALDREFEIRVAKSGVHDRHVIGENGDVLFIGVSMNSIGSTTSVLGSLRDGSPEIWEHYERIWDSADVLGVALPPAGSP